MTAQVSVLIPTWNEEADIETCLECVLSQDYPLDHLEIVLVDGNSADATRDIAEAKLSARDVRYRIITNPGATTPSNLNRGLEALTGEYVCRVDARSFISPQHVRRCVEILSSRPDIAVVGGSQVASVDGGPLQARGIARTLNNRLVMGGARYRSGASSGPDETVYLGSFRTEQLRVLEGWSEDLPTNQDFDLNQRMSRFGLIWFDDTIPARYRPRNDLASLALQYHRFGLAKAEYWRTRDARPLGRQWLLLACGGLVSGVMGGTVLMSKRKRRAILRVGLVGLVIGLLVDELGTARTPAAPAERALAVAAMGAVGGGWLTGVLQGVLRGVKRGRR